MLVGRGTVKGVGVCRQRLSSNEQPCRLSPLFSKAASLQKTPSAVGRNLNACTVASQMQRRVPELAAEPVEKGKDSEWPVPAWV